MKKMTLKKYEKTEQDKRDDKKQAKKHKEPLEKWERSKEDARRDKAAVKKINARRK